MSDLSKIKLNGTVYNFKDAVARTPYYGVCSTAKGTAQKTVTISNIETLIDGLSIFVKFTATNTAENPTLKINNLDPVAIKRYGTTAASTSTASSWNAGAVVQLIYDGTNFIMENFNNTTYSAMTEAEMQTGTATTARNITATRLKQAIEYHAPVTSVNGDTGAVTIDEIQTTAGENNVEYDLIGTAPANTNSGLVPLYKPTLVTFAKTTDYGRLTLGSSDTPGVLRIYSSTTNASGYTDLKTGSSSTNTRTITFPDATGTVALTSDIPSVSSWALAANKPSYTFSELTTTPTSLGGYGITDAYTKTEVDGMVSGVLHYKGTKATVAALPSSGNTTGDTWHVTADGSEWAWDGNDWQELGTAVDLSGYVPTSRTINGKALTSDISLTASDVSALPSSTTYVSSFNGNTGAITYTAPVTSVNGQTGAVTITDSDEKVKYTDLNKANSGKPLLIASGMISGGGSSTDTAYASNRLMWNDYNQVLYIYNSDRSKSSNLNSYRFVLANTTSSYSGTIKTDAITADRTYTFPDKTGTVALISDIPTTASDVGALADDSVAAGITSTDISNWNGKMDNQYMGYLKDGILYAPKSIFYYDNYYNMYSYFFPFIILSSSASITSNTKVREIGSSTDKTTMGSINLDGTTYTTVSITGTKMYFYRYSDGMSSIRTVAVNTDIPTNISDFTNDAGYITSYTETDPTVPSWAKASSKPTYTASEVGAVPTQIRGSASSTDIKNESKKITLSTWDDTSYYGDSDIVITPSQIQIESTGFIKLSYGNTGATISDKIIVGENVTIHNVVTPTADADAATKKYVDDSVSGITHPVTSVNTKTGAVTLSASDVGAVPTTGGTLTGTLTVDAVGTNTNGKIVFQNHNADFGATTTLQQNTMTVQSETMGYLLINGRAAINQTPTFDTAIVNKQYVDTAISGISVPQPYNATTNPTGYLRITDLPIYDGTVV